MISDQNNRHCKQSAAISRLVLLTAEKQSANREIALSPRPSQCLPWYNLVADKSITIAGLPRQESWRDGSGA
jgi:hypothetical protein